jgi:hypothetical protein
MDAHHFIAADHPMALFLVEPDIDLTLELPMSAASLDALGRQFMSLKAGRDNERFCKRLAAEVERVLPEVIDWELKPPTKAQLAFAKSICHRLKVALPASARESRGAMYSFLETHAINLD